MKRFLLTLALISTAAVSSHAAAIAFSNFNNGFSSDPISSSADLLRGNFVRLGTFDNLGDAAFFSANINNLTALNAHFTQFGVMRIGDFGGASNQFDGHLDGSVIRPTPSTDFLSDKQIVLWVFQQSNAQAAPSFALGSQIAHGIFYFDKSVAGALGDAWRIRNDDAVPNDTTISLGDLTDSATHNSLVAGATIRAGSFGADNSDLTGNKNFTLHTIVPEPTTIGLAGLGLLGLLGRRRRK